MFRINGIGTTIYGSAKKRQLLGAERVEAYQAGYSTVSGQAVKWFTILFLPVVPLGTYRVVKLKQTFWTTEPARYRMVRERWDWKQVARHYLFGYSWIVAGVMLTLFTPSSPRIAEHTAPSTRTAGLPIENRAERRRQELFAQDAERVGDSELMTRYQNINERFFSGALPAIPVMWEAGLTEVGPLTAENLVLLGITNGLIVLLNPKIEPSSIEGVLCHEMVHVYFISIGNDRENHGPAFQGVLLRLSQQGAFKEIPGSEAERRSLRLSLDKASGRLEIEREELNNTTAEVDAERGDLDRAVEQLNGRISSANRQGFGWPAEEEIQSVKMASARFDQRVANVNSRLTRDRAEVIEYNRQANRYNLMMSYPDGLDEESLVKAKLSQ